MIYPAVEDIIYIHDRAVEATGGSFGVREIGLLESIAVKPQSSFGGQELYATIFDKAAVLYEALCNYHVFVDGNKRTAALTMYRFLTQNGYDLTVTNSELERYTESIAIHHPDPAEVAVWIKKHSRKVPL